MTVRDLTAALLTAFGLGKTYRDLEQQRTTAVEVSVAAEAVHIERNNVDSVVIAATEEAARF